jgi:uncharacterized membrane-anchored protein YitT (DUF2179 family)
MIRSMYVVFACLVVAVGVIILNFSHLVTGGTAGLSLSLSYLLHVPFFIVFFLINIPFYALSVLRMGWSFTLSTIFAVTVLSVLTGFGKLVPPFSIPPFVGAIVGGAVIGVGLSMLFYHRASLGGANILALYLQRKLGWDPGKTNFAFDFVVVCLGFYSVGLWRGIASILSIAVIGWIISRCKSLFTPEAQKGKQEQLAVKA